MVTDLMKGSIIMLAISPISKANYSQKNIRTKSAINFQLNRKITSIIIGAQTEAPELDLIAEVARKSSLMALLGNKHPYFGVHHAEIHPQSGSQGFTILDNPDKSFWKVYYNAQDGPVQAIKTRLLPRIGPKETNTVFFNKGKLRNEIVHRYNLGEDKFEPPENYFF